MITPRMAIEALGISMETMKPTHQEKAVPQRDICAWKLEKGAHIPLWVFRSFDYHPFKRDTLHNRLDHQEVHPGQWICVDMEKPQSCFILEGDDFSRLFTELVPIPSKA